MIGLSFRKKVWCFVIISFFLANNVYAKNHERTLGWVEKVKLVSINETVKAKLDTGAKTAIVKRGASSLGIGIA